MAAPTDNSFIPKRGSAKQKRQTVTRRVYVFTYISYIITFATLLATGAIFLYGQYVSQELDNEVASLNSEIGNFDQARMQEAVDFDNRLQQAYGRLDNSVSIVSIFTALEAATIDTVEITSLTLNRNFDESFLLSASALTDSFDSTIFQRDVLESNPTLSSVSVQNVQTGLSVAGADETAAPSSAVSFDVDLRVPLQSVTYQPTAVLSPSPSNTNSNATTPTPSASSTTSVGLNNDPTS